MRHITKKIHTGYHMLSCASLSSVQQIHEPGPQVQCPKRSLHPGKTLPSPAASEDRSMSSSHGQGLPELPRGTGVKWDQVLWLCLMPKPDQSRLSSGPGLETGQGQAAVKPCHYLLEELCKINLCACFVVSEITLQERRGVQIFKILKHT